MADSSEALVHAFPTEFVGLARAAISRLPPSQLASSSHSIGPIRINHRPIHIPSRIYVTPVPLPSKVNAQTAENLQRLLRCELQSVEDWPVAVVTCERNASVIPTGRLSAD